MSIHVHMRVFLFLYIYLHMHLEREMESKEEEREEGKSSSIMHKKGENVSHSVIPILYDHMVYSPPGSSVHEICQARILECLAIPFSGGSS